MHRYHVVWSRCSLDAARVRDWAVRALGGLPQWIVRLDTMPPGPRDGVPETGTPSPIGTTFVFFYDQGTVGEVTTLAIYFLLTFQHETHLAPRSQQSVGKEGLPIAFVPGLP